MSVLGGLGLLSGLGSGLVWSGWVRSLIMLIVLVMEARSHANHSLQFASKFHKAGTRLAWVDGSMARWLVGWLARWLVGLSICN